MLFFFKAIYPLFWDKCSEKFERDSVNDVFICTGVSTSKPRIVPRIYRLLTSSKLDKLCYRVHLISTNKWELDF